MNERQPGNTHEDGSSEVSNDAFEAELAAIHDKRLAEISEVSELSPATAGLTQEEKLENARGEIDEIFGVSSGNENQECPPEAATEPEESAPRVFGTEPGDQDWLKKLREHGEDMAINMDGAGTVSLFDRQGNELMQGPLNKIMEFTRQQWSGAEEAGESVSDTSEATQEALGSSEATISESGDTVRHIESLIEQVERSNGVIAQQPEMTIEEIPEISNDETTQPIGQASGEVLGEEPIEISRDTTTPVVRETKRQERSVVSEQVVDLQEEVLKTSAGLKKSIGATIGKLDALIGYLGRNGSMEYPAPGGSEFNTQNERLERLKEDVAALLVNNPDNQSLVAANALLGKMRPGDAFGKYRQGLIDVFNLIPESAGD